MAPVPSPSSSSPQDPPQNTLVVMPKPSPVNSGALWALFWTLGVLMGLFARELVAGPGGGEPALSAGQAAAVGDAATGGESPPTFAVEVRAVLELPTATPTSTPRPAPAATPDEWSRVSFCAGEQPGQICRVPYPPPPTPTPYPSCEDMDLLAPGDFCRWPATTTPAPVLVGENNPGSE